MAIYDGFFDAREDGAGYDRTYDSNDFTGYFGAFVGSGVCIHENESSMLVRPESAGVVVSPGYLFLQGYWLKNDADYRIPLQNSTVNAIVAHLNMAERRIDIESREKSALNVYPDCLVLAYASVDFSGVCTVTDTRYNTAICGVIDSIGEVNDKVAWAIHYIDTEINAKLSQIESNIQAQAALLDSKILEVQSEVEKLEPPPIGTIKFSASANVGSDWLLCDGSFINESRYPELVAALGKLAPSGDKFTLISDGEVQGQLSNGVVYDGRLWAYSHSAKKLYGVRLDGTKPVKDIPVSSSSEEFSKIATPSNDYPIVLSILPSLNGSQTRMFISQIIPRESYASDYSLVILGCGFSGSESSISLLNQLDGGIGSYRPYATYIPSVVSYLSNGTEKFVCVAGMKLGQHINYYYTTALEWSFGGEVAFVEGNCRGAYSRNLAGRKTKFESVIIGNDGDGYAIVESLPLGLFRSSSRSSKYNATSSLVKPSSIIGNSYHIFNFDTSRIYVLRRPINSVSLVNIPIKVPAQSRVFVDGGLYLWSKDIYLIFVGTGIIFTRDPTNQNSFGYLDTTNVLGVITQFGYMDTSDDESEIYIMGQDSSNRVKVAKMKLNTLYDYANDGAWLPLIASDGVPAYIKAR